MHRSRVGSAKLRRREEVHRQHERTMLGGDRCQGRAHKVVNLSPIAVHCIGINAISASYVG